MDDKNENDGFFKELRADLQELRLLVGDALRQGAVALRNRLRRMRGARIDYVVLPISGTLPERSGPPRNFIQRQLPLPPEPLSMQELNDRLRRIAEAENVRGAVFLLQEMTAPGLATLQNLRRSIERLHENGKEAIVYTPYLDLAHYYVATAADAIVVPPSANFEVLGLYVELVFLRDALEQIGIRADVLQISPYKTAGNIFDKAEMTPEQREQLEWLLEDNFDMITAGIAAGRSLTQAAVQALVDQAPFPATRAQDAGLVDAIAYEDELPRLLGRRLALAADDEAEEQAPEGGGEAEGEEVDGDAPHARLLGWNRARRVLFERARRPTESFVGVVRLEGTIITGSSRRPPVELPIPFIGGVMAGHETINRLLRRAERNRRMAALIFYVDSPGGSALASDLIWRQIHRIAQKKPVLVYMGNVAASGGYYVAAGADHIMAQRGTLTGSIGVLAALLSTHELYEKLHLNRAALKRGRHADLFSGSDPLDDEERELLWSQLVHTYRQFLARVGGGRDLAPEVVEQVAGGRVWTGRQAAARRLVDSHGDFVDAIEQAARMAGIVPDDAHQIPVINFDPRGRGYLSPRPFETATPELQALVDSLTLEAWRAWNGRPLLLLPYAIRWR